jgi:hypothetical protein
MSEPLPEARPATEWQHSMYTAEQMHAYAAARVAAKRERILALVCDGWTVLQHLHERAQKRTSHQNVSDTLDALPQLSAHSPSVLGHVDYLYISGERVRFLAKSVHLVSVFTHAAPTVQTAPGRLAGGPQP